MGGRKRVTIDMLEAAKKKGWTMTMTARHYCMHHTSISAACERFGIVLPRHQHISAVQNSKKAKMISEASDKKRPAWSASPAAIERALAKKSPLQTAN